MEKTPTGYKFSAYPAFWLVAVILSGITWSGVPAYASAPRGHVIIAEQVIRRIMKDPNANPELRALLSGNPDARRAFSGGACAPDLDSISDKAHTEDPKGVADKLMQTARGRYADAQAALAAAGSPAEKALAERVLQQAKCDLAFAYGWLTHAAADLETHPFVNASGNNYWEDSTDIDKALHGEWETMQETNWVDKYGPPLDPNVDYRLGLLEAALGLDHDALINNIQTLSYKESGAAFVGDKYTQGQLDDWKAINDKIGDDSIDRAVDFLNSPSNPLDDSCWDIGWGISLDDFRKFIEDTKKKSGGELPEGFWVSYDDWFNTWKTGGAGTGGSNTGASGTSGVSNTPSGTMLPAAGSAGGASMGNTAPGTLLQAQPQAASPEVQTVQQQAPPEAQTVQQQAPPEFQPAPVSKLPW